ncbi:hypothetical protein L6164_021542 [Bauhinia variegata]|uniref:Uncharacterized protein n=1 Tax=Bauhinia variegata TaxID=167791 RepID=A0ACB9MZ50_BAUVA|nr:hypothetical protein L6164_021542 [Bauhinia variegata]
MALFSGTVPINCNRITSFPLLFASLTRNATASKIYLPQRLPRKRHALGWSSLFSYQSSIPRDLYLRKKTSISLVAFNSKKSESGEEDNQALDAVLKLYSAITNRNIHQLSEILADECRCVCNFSSFFQAFQGKKQVMEFFGYLIETFGKNFQIIVKPTLHEGMQVGVQWKFAWKKTHMPLGKGFSFHICQSYHGKAVIKNIEMFMEPLLCIEPFRLKMIATLSSLMAPDSENKANKILWIGLALLCFAAFLFFLRLALQRTRH